MTPEDQPRKITAAEARELLTELDESGLSIAEFARQREVQRAPIYNARRQARLAKLDVSRKQFVQVAVRNEPAPVAVVAAETIEVELPNRCRLHVPANVDASHLRRVLEVIRSC